MKIELIQGATTVVDLGEGARPPPLFWVKKEEMTEGKMADRASKSRPPPPLDLDPPLNKYQSINRLYLKHGKWLSKLVFRLAVKGIKGEGEGG